MKRKHAFFTSAASLLLCMSLLAGCFGKGDSTPATHEDGQVTKSAVSTMSNAPSKDDLTDESSGDEYDLTATGAYEDGSTPDFSTTRLRLTVNGEEEVIIALYDNTAADALLQRLPLENLSFYDLSGIEKPIQRLQEPLSLGQEEPGYDPITGEMVIYRPWANFTIFYGDFRYSPELVPLGKVVSGLEVISDKDDDFTGVLELIVNE